MIKLIYTQTKFFRRLSLQSSQESDQSDSTLLLTKCLNLIKKNIFHKSIRFI